jgi:TPR repeat protein
MNVEGRPLLTTSLPFVSFGRKCGRAALATVLLSVAFSLTAFSAPGNVGDDIKLSSAPAFIASNLSVEKRKELDVEFFNLFWHKNASSPQYPASARAARIREIAGEGFEVAYLADKLFVLDKYGAPIFIKAALPHWDRLGQLAAQGDPSAQCLFVQAANEYRSFGVERDKSGLARKYLEAAAGQEHPYCLRLWSAEAHGSNEAEDVRHTRKCALAGAAICQHSLAGRYSSGRGLPRDRVKGLCWLQKARTTAHSQGIDTWFRIYRGNVEEEVGDDRTRQLVERAATTNDCDSLAAD